MASVGADFELNVLVAFLLRATEDFEGGAEGSVHLLNYCSEHRCVSGRGMFINRILECGSEGINNYSLLWKNISHLY